MVGKMPECDCSSDLILKNKQAFHGRLLSWYRNHRRELPWRQSPSLYKTVVSEFMLQQTQVETVISYFNRWLCVLPDFQTLARAKESQVLKQWEGLGYYSRARFLHRLARQIVQLKEIPKDAQSWQRFPGVGPYLSAAITSICFGTPVAVVDGNVIRVLSRLLAIVTTFKDGASAARALRPLAQILIDVHRAGDYNQAMMELGATVCLRQKPLCGFCPIRGYCQAYKSGIPQAYPRFSKRKTARVSIQRLWLIHKGALLLQRQDKTARRLAEIYELPLLEKLPFQVADERLLAVRKRSISNQRIEEEIYAVHLTQENILRIPSSANLHWVSLNRLKQITLSGPHRRWIAELLAYGAPHRWLSTH